MQAQQTFHAKQVVYDVCFDYSRNNMLQSYVAALRRQTTSWSGVVAESAPALTALTHAHLSRTYIDEAHRPADDPVEVERARQEHLFSAILPAYTAVRERVGLLAGLVEDMTHTCSSIATCVDALVNRVSLSAPQARGDPPRAIPAEVCVRASESIGRILDDLREMYATELHAKCSVATALLPVELARQQPELLLLPSDGDSNHNVEAGGEGAGAGENVPPILDVSCMVDALQYNGTTDHSVFDSLRPWADAGILLTSLDEGNRDRFTALISAWLADVYVDTERLNALLDGLDYVVEQLTK